MSFDLQRMLESKRAFRQKLAARPVTEKLRLLDELRARALAIHRSPVLEPFADSVQIRFDSWLAQKTKNNIAFTTDQLAWLRLIATHIATSLSIEQDDLELSPFNQRGGLGKAHQLFGEQLPKLLNELNEVLAA